MSAKVDLPPYRVLFNVSMNLIKNAVVVLLFGVFSLLLCLPQLQGKKFYQADNIVWQQLTYQARAYHDSTGKDVLWINNVNCGMPGYALYFGAANRNYISYIQQGLQLVGKPAYFFFIAMLGFYLLMLVAGVNIWTAAMGAFAYAMCSYQVIIVCAGHETQSLTAGYWPIALAGLVLLYRGQWIYGAAMFSAAIALMVSNSHYQMLYYAMIVFIAFGIVAVIEAIRRKKVKHVAMAVGIAIVAGTLGLSVGASSLLTVKEYVAQTKRGGKSQLSIHDDNKKGGLDKGAAFEWSCAVPENLCLMVPYLYGGSSYEPAEHAPETSQFATGPTTEFAPMYWGAQPVVLGPFYVGAVVCFLFLLGLLLVPSIHKWWMLAVALLGIVLACGKNLAVINYFLFDHAPFLNMFRAVPMAKVMVMVTFPLLGLLAFHFIFKRRYDPKKIDRYLLISAGATAGVCLFLAIGINFDFLFSFSAPTDTKLQQPIVDALKLDRKHLALMSSLTSAGLILAAAGLLWAYTRQKINPRVLLITFALLLVVDLFPVAKNYLPASKFVDESEYQANFEPTEADKQIMQDKALSYRVLDITGNPFEVSKPSMFHKCIGGVSPTMLENYSDLVESQLYRGFNYQVLNMLNTKYVVSNVNGKPTVMPDTSACGNAWFVERIKWAATADEEMKALDAQRGADTARRPDSFEPLRTAVINTRFRSTIGAYSFSKDSAARITLTSCTPDELLYTSDTKSPGLAVFSEIYYPKDWKAFIDGVEVPIINADYVLRALKVPAGHHAIRFSFEPTSFYLGQKITMCGSILIALLCIGAFIKFLLDATKAAEVDA